MFWGQMMVQITAEIFFDSIYDDSACRIVLTGTSEFKAKFSGEILKANIGITSNDFIESEIKEERSVIDIIVIRWAFERKLDESISEFRTSNQYGMRYFPFVSSQLRGGITVIDAKISVVFIELPDKYRIIRAGINVHFGEFKGTKVSHDRGEINSRYIFQPKEHGNIADIVTIDLPVRLGGNALLRITEFPVYYGIISFLAVALAGLTGDGRIFVASIVAIYSFMLRHWLNSNPPQRSILLTRLYLFTGILLVIWGIVFLSLKYWAITFAPLLILAVYFYYKAVRYFSFTGKLPGWLENYWKSQIDKTEKKQIKTYNENIKNQ